MDLFYSIDNSKIHKSELGSIKNIRLSGSAHTYDASVDVWIKEYTRRMANSLFEDYYGPESSYTAQDVTSRIIFVPVVRELRVFEDLSSRIRIILEIYNMRRDLLYRLEATGEGEPDANSVKVYGVFTSHKFIQQSLERSYYSAFSRLYNSYLENAKEDHLKPVDHCHPKCWNIRMRDGRVFRYAAIKIDGRTLEARFLNGVEKSFLMSSVAGMEIEK